MNLDQLPLSAQSPRIITNNAPRNMLYWHDLTAKEQENFDWMEDPEAEDFFRYKGYVYALCEFMRCPQQVVSFHGWHGYTSEGFFSGIVVKVIDDQVIVGRYYS